MAIAQNAKLHLGAAGEKALTEIRPVILCGGAGSRLWPLSTPEKPKPFHGFGQSRTLFQQALLRTRHAVFGAPPVVVAHLSHARLVRTQSQELDIAIDLVLEPEGRDSCAAAMAGILQASRDEPNNLVAIMAADHHIPDGAAFAEGYAVAATLAKAGRLVTFGVAARWATPEYGYILPDGDGVRFVEKPPLAQATRLIAQGARWNSGNFLGRADVWRAETARHAATVLQAVEKAFAGAVDGCLGHDFVAAPRQSLDVAIFEKSNRVVMVPVDYAWSDVGTWDEVARLKGADGPFVLTDHARVLAPGLDDLIIVSDGKQLLVTKRGQSQALKQLLREEAKA